MYGPILSVLLMGVIPMLEVPGVRPVTDDIRIAPPAIINAGQSPFGTLDERLTASGAIIVDLDSSQTLYTRESAVARPMASLTKLMTALIITENHELTEIVRAPNDIHETVGNVARLQPGDQFTVGDLLSALLTLSANDAAVTLARFHSGSVEAFAEAMNARAKELGLTATSYQNPAGLDAPTQKSSPQDLAWLTMFVMKRPEIAQRMSMLDGSIVSLAGRVISLNHTHVLLHADPLITAGKTGTTDDAGQCLLSIVEVKGRRFIVILLHSRDRYTDMRTVLQLLES